MPAPLGATDQIPARIVFLGDSITDGHTYPLLVQASLATAWKPVPKCLNAGIGGDTAEGMLARLDRDVSALRPTLVSASAYVNDVVWCGARDLRSPDVRDRRQTSGQRHRSHAANDERSPQEAAQKLLDATNEIVRRIARDKKTRLGDVAAQFQPAVAAGEDRYLEPTVAI